MVKKRTLAIFTALALLTVTEGSAHPLHSSFAELRRERDDAITISVRLFADDFGALLDSLGTLSPGQSREIIASAYVKRGVTVSTTDGRGVPTAWCGMRAEPDVVLVCVRSAPIPGAFRVRNTLMFDRFADQISIIRWEGKKGTRTLILSARAPEGRLE